MQCLSGFKPYSRWVPLMSYLQDEEMEKRRQQEFLTTYRNAFKTARNLHNSRQ